MSWGGLAKVLASLVAGIAVLVVGVTMLVSDCPSVKLGTSSVRAGSVECAAADEGDISSALAGAVLIAIGTGVCAIVATILILEFRRPPPRRRQRR